jgi:hypothetical protein
MRPRLPRKQKTNLGVFHPWPCPSPQGRGIFKKEDEMTDPDLSNLPGDIQDKVKEAEAQGRGYVLAFIPPCEDYPGGLLIFQPMVEPERQGTDPLTVNHSDH